MNYFYKKAVRTKLKLDAIFNKFDYILGFNLDIGMSPFFKQLKDSKNPFFVCSNPILSYYLTPKTLSLANSLKSNVFLIYFNDINDFYRVRTNPNLHKLFVFKDKRFIFIKGKNISIEKRFDHLLFHACGIRLINILKQIK